MRVYHLLIGIILLALSPFIFKSVFKKAPTNNELKPQQPVPSPTVSSTPSSGLIPQVTNVAAFKPVEGNIWKNFLGTTSAPTGWSVAPCEGDAPLLCVSSEGKNLGSVEMAVYPLQQQPKLQRILETNGINAGVKIDYENPYLQEKVFQEQIVSALNTWITEDYVAMLQSSRLRMIAKERRQKYADKITFSSYPPQTVTVGKLQGMRYGFTGLKRKGGIQEQHLKYVAFDGDALYVINTAFDPGRKTGKFDRYENLAVFEPFLSAIAANLKLPN
ncbi:hypothetical protein [Brunnivagina elsteri]|uniref:Uncharacterized protein n=1 Tax=Brunnivagina elsteri CCALA 953 TaxID=987040 RepID=A0A2A2TH81_9CYAN|nr:hypothetical protein [Calothrix elsteri]PAX52988.1 hypothetical protein CK510_16405 [Calothrix elsteri CCALA 953]